MIRCKGSWVERIAKKMSLNNVVFLDKLPSDELYRLMYKARAVVMPSIWPEPFGRIPVEANRLGIPAVVSSAGGLPETIVNGVTGYIWKIAVLGVSYTPKAWSTTMEFMNEYILGER